MPTPDEPHPEGPDGTLRQIEDLVQRTQRSLLEGLEGAVARQIGAVLEGSRRTALAHSEEVLGKHVELLVNRLRGELRTAAEELRQHHLGPLLERLRQALREAVEELRQQHLGPWLAQLQDALREALGEVLRRELDLVVQRARQEVRAGGEFVRAQTDMLVGKVREEVAAPVLRALRDQVPGYARWVGGRVIDYALAVTLFCLATVFLLGGTVQGLEHVGLPRYLTWLLGGAGALGAGLVFLWLYGRAWPGHRGGPGPPQNEQPPP
jgi:hypothetical protein